MKYPIYEHMKKLSGGWIVEVPRHWNVCSVKRLTKTITDGAHISPETENGVYCFVSTKDIRNDLIDFDNCLRTSAESYEYLVRMGCKPLSGDVLFSKDGTIGRTVVVQVEKKFVVASSLVIIRPNRTVLSPEFLNYLCQSGLVAGQVESFVRGAGLPRLSIQNLLKIVGVFPPIDEQKDIASFLDRKTILIDILIAKRQHQVELLQEQRAALISRAVTKGINPDVLLKESGVEWLGVVPEHWGVKALRYLCRIETGDKDTINAEENGDYPFFVRSQTVERINTFTKDCEAVLTAGDGVGVGKVFHYVNGKFDFHQRVYMFGNFKHVLGKFFFHFLRENFRKVAFNGGAKSTVDSLRRPMIASFPVVVPPLSEQRTIIAFLDCETAKFDGAVRKLRESIEKLREYRQSLISAAVTGKIDVRKWKPSSEHVEESLHA